MLGNQQRKVGVGCPLLHILIAVSVDRDDTVGILIDNDSVRIHTEGSHIILKLLGAIYDFALIQFIGQMRENNSGQLYPYANVNSIGLGGDL